MMRHKEVLIFCLAILLSFGFIACFPLVSATEIFYYHPDQLKAPQVIRHYHLQVPGRKIFTA